MLGYYWGDWTWIILLPAFVLVMWAQSSVQGTFRKYAQVWAGRGMTGAQVAAAILRDAGLDDVRVERVPGHLSDHYDPRAKVLRLSDSTYASASVAAIGVAAHEVGHAIQHDVGYLPLQMRSWFVPLANLGSSGGPVLFLIGLFIRSGVLLQLGILFFGLAVAFYLITLPVEFDASNRALRILEGHGYLGPAEMEGARAVLRAAALTYVAAAAMAISQLLRMLVLAGAGRRRD